MTEVCLWVLLPRSWLLGPGEIWSYPVVYLTCSLLGIEASDIIVLVEEIEQEASPGQEELGIQMQPFCSV